jgi:plastocyanin
VTRVPTWRRAATAPRAATLLAVVVATVVLGACSSSAGSAAAASPVATTTVDLPKSYKFEPAAIIVAAGATVTWKNDDNFTHSVQLDGVASPGLVMKPGQSVTQSFPTAGTFHYVCAFHPQNMKGTVVVTAAAAPSS